MARRQLLNLHCFEAFCQDLAQYDKKLQRRIRRGVAKKANKMLTDATKKEMTQYQVRTGYLKKSVKGRIKIKKDAIRIVSGLRKVKPELYKNKRHDTKKPPPAVYAGVWLNFGTKPHSNRKGDFLERKHRSAHGNKKGKIAGVEGSNWVNRVWQAKKTQVEQALVEDMEAAMRDSFKKNYR